MRWQQRDGYWWSMKIMSLLVFREKSWRVVVEAEIACKFARVCTQTTIPYARDMEVETLPNARRIRNAVMTLLEKKQ